MSAQTKKQQELWVERIVNIPSDEVWNTLAVDYGAIANSHPTIIKSEYAAGTLKGNDGAEKKCYFNEKGPRCFMRGLLDGSLKK